MKQGPPPRLLDDAEAAPALREDLRRVSSAAPDYDVAAGLAGLRAVLAAPLGGQSAGEGAASAGEGAANAGGSAAASGELAAAGASASAGAGLASGKIALGVIGAVALVAVGMAVLQPRAAEREQAKPASAERAASSTAPRPALRATEPEPAAEAPTAVPAAANQPAPPAGGGIAPALRGGASLHDADGALRREIAQLARIKALLPRDPHAAYRLVQSGQREFPRGVLAQEREALGVLALSALGDARGAARDARAFLSRYPDSPLRERMAAVAAAAGAGER